MSNRLICNEYNFDVDISNYAFKERALYALCSAFDKIRLDLPSEQQHVLVKHRSRGIQVDTSLQRLHSALIPCVFGDWLTTVRQIRDLKNIYSIDYKRLKIPDLYDYYICPDDYYLDKHGDKPVEGPVFADFRDGKFVGICIRNLNSEAEYVKDVKYTFSNYGWYLFGYDDYKATDEVYIVEGVFDALAMKAMGYNAIALGSSMPSPMQLAMLLYKYKNINFCLDNDLAGFVGAYVTSLLLNVPMFLNIGFKDLACCYESNSKPVLEKVCSADLKYLISLALRGNIRDREIPYNLTSA